MIKQIHRDNQSPGFFIPFTSQQYIHAIQFWANQMHILGSQFQVEDINEPLAEIWSESLKIEQQSAVAPTDLTKSCKIFKKDTKWHQWKQSVLTSSIPNQVKP